MIRFAALLILPVLLLACGNSDTLPPTSTTQGEAPQATATTRPATPTSVPATPTTAPQPTALPGVPSGTETGNPIIDRIIAVMLAGDANTLAMLFVPTETPCTTAQGAGGPPKCAQAPGSPPNGTRVQAVPYSTCEGGWAYDLKVHSTLLTQNKLSLYGVARFGTPQPPYGNEPGYPLMEQMILFEFSAGGTPRIGLIVGVANGGIVYTRHICVGPPEQALTFYGQTQLILRGPAYQ